MINPQLSLDGGITTTDSNFTWSDLSSFDPYYTATSPSAILLVAGSFFALIISIPGLAWHIQNRNLPAASMVGWIVLLNIQNIINALIWPNDNITTWWNGEIYCDIEIKLEVAATMGLVGSLACIFRSLATALDTTNIRLVASKGQRIRQLILENSLCVILPLVLASLHLSIQPIRYYIFSISGCKASYQGSWSPILLNFIWPPLVCILIIHYALLLISRIHRYRRDFSAILSNSTTGMNKSRFLRLFGSAMAVFIVVLPIQAYAFAVNVEATLNDGWHTPDWEKVVYVPMFGIVFADRWVRLGMSVPIFVCFGWGRDAKSLYKAWLKLLGLQKLFPSLFGTQDDTTGGRARNPRKPALWSTSSTIISKARSLFSRQDKDSGSPTSSSTGKGSMWSSTTSSSNGKPYGRSKKDALELEAQKFGIELEATSRKIVEKDDDMEDVALGPGRRTEAQRKNLEYEGIVVDGLTY